MTRGAERVLAGAVLTVAVAYAAWHLTRDWVPHDEGTLALAAERVLAGEWPHRDFDDVYTGGLAWLHAATFRYGDASLAALRLTVLAAFALALAALWSLARHAAPPAGAALVVALATAWGLPNYPAAMPSWFLLAGACISCACLARWLEVRRVRWLVAAGLVIGLTVLVKVSGLFLLMGAFLWCLEMDVRRAAQAGPAPAGRPPVRHGTAVALLAALPALVVALLVRQRLAPAEAVFLLLPVAAASTYVALGALRSPAAERAFDVGPLLRTAGPLALAAAAPLGLFALPYLLDGSAGALVHGVFVAPFRRVTAAASPLPAARTLLLGALPLLLVTGQVTAPWLERGAGRWLLPGALLAALLLAGSDSVIYRTWFGAARALLPLVACAAVVARALDAERTEHLPGGLLALLLAMAAAAGLVQFPFGAPVYFCYAAPLGFLAALGVARVAGAAPARLALTAGAFTLFAVLWMNPGSIRNLGRQAAASDATAPLPVPRAGLRVPPADSAEYGQLLARLEAVAPAGGLLAFPDAPEVYFLAGRANPTRSLYEFLSEDAEATMHRLVTTPGALAAVVVNRRPGFSDGPSPALQAAIDSAFPRGETVGRFALRWR